MVNKLRHLFGNSSLPLVFLLIATLHLVPANTYAEKVVGAVTAVQKDVYVVHPGKAERLLVSQGDNVIFSDVYETGPEANAKLLFDDDTLITLGENTRLRVSENIYKPAKKQRSTVLDLLSGSARALVGKTFSGAKSKFEIHTPTTVAAAKGTYFIVKFYEEEWLSEVFNLSHSSIVEISSKDPTQGGSVKLRSNEIASIKRSGSIVVLAMGDQGFSKKFNQALSDTEMKEEPMEESTGLQELTSSQIAKYEFDSNLPGDDCRQSTLSSSSKSSVSSLLGECDDGQNIPQQLPPGLSAGSPGNSPVTLEINFQ